MSLSASPEVLDLCKQVVETAQPVIEAVTSVQATNSQILTYVFYGFIAGFIWNAILTVIFKLVADWLDARKVATHD